MVPKLLFQAGFSPSTNCLVYPFLYFSHISLSPSVLLRCLPVCFRIIHLSTCWHLNSEFRDFDVAKQARPMRWSRRRDWVGIWWQFPCDGGVSVANQHKATSIRREVTPHLFNINVFCFESLLNILPVAENEQFEVFVYKKKIQKWLLSNDITVRCEKNQLYNNNNNNSFLYIGFFLKIFGVNPIISILGFFVLLCDIGTAFCRVYTFSKRWKVLWGITKITRSVPNFPLPGHHARNKETPERSLLVGEYLLQIFDNIMLVIPHPRWD